MKNFVVVRGIRKQTVCAMTPKSAINKVERPPRGWHWEVWGEKHPSLMGHAVVKFGGQSWYMGLQDNG